MIRIDKVFGFAATVIDKIFPDKNKADEAKQKLIATLGWLCVILLFWVYLGLPVTKAVVAIQGLNVVLPEIDSTATMKLIVGILWLSYRRTFEKIKGVASR